MTAVALLLAAAAELSTPASPRVVDPAPALCALGPAPLGETQLTVLAGQPVHSARVDRGFGDWFDVGIAVEVAASGFVRPKLRSRFRALRAGIAQLVLRTEIGAAFSSHFARRYNGELSLALQLALHPRLAAFGEVGGLVSTSFTYERTAAFATARGGMAFAPFGPFAVLASAGVLRGSLGTRGTATGGAQVRF
jgi:hypothetical protein